MVNMVPELKDLKGVGPKMQSALIEAGFQEIEKIANTTIDDLVKVPGIGKAKAEKLITQAQELLASTPQEQARPKTAKKETKAKKSETKAKPEKKPKTEPKTKKTEPKTKKTEPKTKKTEPKAKPVKKPRKRAKTTPKEPKQFTIKPGQAIGVIEHIRLGGQAFHAKQAILKLYDSLEEDASMFIGRRIKAQYPSKKMAYGKIVQVFGRPRSKKVLVHFNKGISLDLQKNPVILA